MSIALCLAFFVLCALLMYIIIKQKNEKNELLKRAEKSEELLKYFTRRDSLTGQMDRAYAAESFARLIKKKRRESNGGAMVRIKKDIEREEDVTEKEILQVSVVLASLGLGEVCRMSAKEFLIFTKDCCGAADKIYFFLSKMKFEGLLFAVGAERFDEHEENFDFYLKRMNRSLAAAEISGCCEAVH